MESAFRQGVGIEGYGDRRRRGSREEIASHGQGTDMIEGDSSAVRRGARVRSVNGGVQMSGGDARLEDNLSVALVDALTVVEYG